MRNVHVNPEEAVMIHQDIQSRKSLGIHWGTFKLTNEFYMEPKTKTFAAAKDAGLKDEEFSVVDIGETVNV